MLTLWWTKVRDRFPKYEQAAPLSPSVEEFNGPERPKIDFRISDAPPTPRLLMMSESDAEVLQIQEDRFGYSWRKLSVGAEYPRYSRIRQVFTDELASFERFLDDEKLEGLSPVQCEVTYVNVILFEGTNGIHAELGKIMPSANPRLSEGFLPCPEQTRYASQFVILGAERVPLGRLFVSAEPSYLLNDERQIYLMKLTFRGKPQRKEVSAVAESMDLGHEWIVRGFATLTSREMHRIWGRTA